MNIYLGGGAAVPSASFWMPVLAACIAAGAALGAAFFSLQAARKQRSLAREIKLAEFRQTWINELRDSMITMATSVSEQGSEQDDHLRALVRLQLVMNPNEKLYPGLIAAAKDLWTETRKHTSSVENIGEEGPRDEDLFSAIKQYKVICQSVLKAEWERLKIDIRKAAL